MDEGASRAAIEDLVDEGFFAWMGVWKAQAVVTRAIERTLKEHGLSLTWGEVLSRLGAAPQGRLRMQELARQVFVSKSGISQVVSQMSRAGLVARQGDPDNLRITYAVLTDEGRRILANTTPAFLGAIRQHFSQQLSAEEARTIAEAMNRVIKSHGEQPDTPDRREAIENLYRVVGARPDTTDLADHAG